MAKKSSTQLDFARIGDEINVLLTDIYGKYVAQGSPTKLGGLRFLDVPSAKTFAFEKTGVAENGNLMILSAPYDAKQPDKSKFVPLHELLESTGLPAALKSGPYGESFREAVVRASYDKGKAGKFFVEVAYYLPTGSWLDDEDVAAYAEKNRVHGHEAVVRILRDNVLPIADQVMDQFVQLVRDL
ncbi:MAG: hypothetical protein HY319_03300 [Armatimonadetes bacterium]|nr:hypothetical protein [Armatimonadota bacterium]